MQENGPSSIIHSLLIPMFTSGKDQHHFLGLNNSPRLGLSVKEDCSEVDNSVMDYKSIKRENPNSRKKVTRSCSRGHWKPSEDEKLKELVDLYGPQNWNLIAENLEGRSGKSCRLRWYNQLDPKINKRAFTEEEEERLVEAHRVYGNKWAFISRLFPGRTYNSVKNHWHVMMARNYRHKTNSYIKNKWIMPSSKPPFHQPTIPPQNLLFSNYDIFEHGKEYSPGSTSQVSFAAPISSTEFVESPRTPKFIDFLGVGSIQL